jgi:hypothetical protein
MGHDHEHKHKHKHTHEHHEDKKKEPQGCDAPAYHKMHICVLRHMGQMQILDELSTKPVYRCSRCGAEAAAEKNLCQPRPL